VLWVGTADGGLNRFDRATGKFYSYHTKKNGNLFCVLSLHEDRAGRFWVGSYLNGLYQFDRKKGNIIRHLTESSGLLRNEVYSIAEDATGHLLLMNERGITRYNPVNGHIQNFMSGSVFPENDIVVGDINTNGHGITNTFVFGLRSALVSFNTQALDANATPPVVHIENVTCIDPLYKDSAKIIRPINIKKIELAYNQNQIRFDYVALHFDDPSQNKYAYKLDGYDKDWIDAGTLRNVTYTNLSPGTYTFHVKACNSDGIWNNTGDSVTIIIYSSLWMRWWAWLIYVALFSTAIYSLINYRSRALKRQNQLLEERINQRTRQLSDANKELSEQQEEILTQRDRLAETVTELKNTQQQLIQQEKLASLGELTAGIAHEIQNPLNFVNNFSEVSMELIDEMQQELKNGDKDEAIAIADDIKQNLEKIHGHGKRADGIVKNMLQHSRASTGEKQPTDINNLTDEYLRLSYHGLRAKDKLFNSDMTTHFDEKLPKPNVIPQDIGRVLLNIFNNSFYAMQQQKAVAGESYKPMLTVTTTQKDRFAEITINDNGTGMPENVKEKMMQPFFTTKPTGEGTGLGLSLSYDIIVKVHGGSIDVDTTPGKGTTMTIRLPL
jgi:signal transduction histidine kinase